MSKTTTEKIAALRKEIDNVTLEQLKKIRAGLEHRVASAVDKRIDNILAAALGFSDSWGRLEVDHCNGRKTAIADEIGRFAMDRVKASVDSWIATVADEGKLPKGWKQAMKKEYEERLSYKLSEAVRRHADEFAASQAEQLLTQALSMSEKDLAREALSEKKAMLEDKIARLDRNEDVSVDDDEPEEDA